MEAFTVWTLGNGKPFHIVYLETQGVRYGSRAASCITCLFISKGLTKVVRVGKWG